MENLPIYIHLTFIVTTIATLWIFFKAIGYAKKAMLLLLLWTVIQSALGIAGFYNDPLLMAKRFPLLVLPILIVLLSLFFTKKGKAFIDSLDIKWLTLLHIIRIPVEIILLWLFINNTIPKAMTFEGRNFDILSGLSALLIYYFGFVKNRISKPILIAWNAVCILLLVNVVSSAILSLPTRYAAYGFEQSNIAVGYFPFVLLPSLLVPLVLFANLASIRLISKTMLRDKPAQAFIV